MNKNILSIVFVLAIFNYYSQTDSLFYKQARTFYENEDYEKAYELYSKVISINPNYLKAYQDRGSIYLLIKKTKLAFQDFIYALKLDSLNSESNDLNGALLRR